MVERFFLLAYRLARYRAWWVLGGAALIALLALLYTFVISDLEVRSSFLDLLPQQDELIARFKESQEALERIDYLQILIELREPPEDEAERERLLLEASSRLIAHLKKNPEIVEASDRPAVALPELMVFTGGRERLQELLSYVERIEARLPSPLRTWTASELEGALSASGGGRLSAVYSRVNEALEEALTRGGEAGSSGSGGFDPERLVAGLSALRELTDGVQQTLTILEEPGGLEQDIAGLIGALDALRQEAQGQVFLSPDKTAILVSARPRLSSQAGGVTYCRKVVRLIEDAVASAGLKERFRVGLTGSYAFAAESDQLIKRDMSYTTLIASFGLTAIYLLTLGGVIFPVLIAIPLFVAMLFTLAWAKLVTGGLNLITSLLPSQILGWGDYGVHLVARYIEGRKRRLRIGPALKETLLSKGLPTLIGGVTTAVAILTLLFGRSRGIFEMGIVFSFGILLILALTIFLLPALIVLSHFVFRRTFRKRRRFQLKFDRLIPWVSCQRWPIILATITLSLALVFPASQIRFRFVSQQLLPQRMASQLVRQEIQEKGFKLEQLKLGDYFIFFAKDEAELERITTGLSRIELVQSVDSLASYLTPELQGQEGLSLSGEIAAGREQLGLVQANLGERAEIQGEAQRLVINLSSLQALAALSGQGELARETSSLIQSLLDLNNSLERVEPESLMATIASLERGLDRLGAKLEETFPSGDPFALAQAFLQEWFKTPKGEFIIYAKVDSKIYQPEYYRRFIEEVSQFSRVYFGAAMIQDRLEHYMRRDFWVTTAISAALMLAILLWDFRRSGERHYALLALLPLALGYLWMLGGMRLLGMEFNFTNILISPLLIGLGVDNGVHIVHGYLERRKAPEALASTALAIFITSSTTMVSFGALLLAQTPGLRLLGEAALLGLGFNTIFSLTFLPAVLALRATPRGED